MIELIMVVIISILAYNLKELKEENAKLKKQLEQYIKNKEVNIQQVNINNDLENKVSENEHIIENTMVNESFYDRNKKKENRKNTMILVSGSILIVLAAIVFLLSTWNTMPNIIKTAILVLLIGVFLGISKFAKKVFKLEQASKTFYFIAMAYIPIVMISISVFKLFGTYLSSVGEGKYIYFSAVSIILAGMYMRLSLKNSSKPLMIFSIIMQIIAVICTCLIFTTNKYVIIAGILLYNLILNIIQNNNGYKDYKNMYIITNSIIFYVMASIIMSATVIKWILSSCEIIDILIFILLTLNAILMKQRNKMYNFIYILSLLATILTIINMEGIEIIRGGKLLIMSVSIIALNVISYLETRQLLYKIISYITSNMLIFSMLYIFEIIELAKYIPFVTTLTIFIIEEILGKQEKEEISVYLMISFIVTFLTLNIGITISTFMTMTIASVAFIQYTKKYQKTSGLYTIPMLAVIPSIYMSEIFETVNFDFSVIISLGLVVLTTIMSIRKTKISESTIFSLIYMIVSFIKFNTNIYFSLILVLGWSLIHIVRFDKKDIFKFIAYCSGLILYTNAIKDIGIEDITIINVTGYIIFTYLTTRTILINKGNEYKVLEYIFTILIYVYAMSMYTSIADAMMFVVLLFILVVYGYTKKYGPMFLTSLIAIIINMLQLTKEFWYSIPWWVYILAVGMALIAFAVRNEINQKGDIEKIGNVFKRLKEKIDI